MTLIATQLSHYGIVLATDSNLTDSAYRFARQSRKNFELPHLRGGLSVAGCWSVNGIAMDEWMPRFIARPETFAGGSLAAFAGHLRMALESEMLPAEKRLGSMIHIAGYAREGDSFHPEFYFVRNFEKIEDDGSYSGMSDTFASDEQFWNRDCQHRESPTGFSAHGGEAHVYVNGFPEGRIGYLAVQQCLIPFFGSMWGNPDWRFHPPRSLQESMCYVRLFMAIINGLFEVSDYPAPFIGGEIQVIGIPPP